MSQRKWDRNERGSAPHASCNQFCDLPKRVSFRSPEFIYLALRSRILERAQRRLSNVAHMDRLQPGPPATDQRNDGRQSDYLRQGTEKGIVGSKHDARTQNYGAEKRLPYQQVSTASGADIEGVRGGIRPDPGNMNKALHVLLMAGSGNVARATLMNVSCR